MIGVFTLSTGAWFFQNDSATWIIVTSNDKTYNEVIEDLKNTQQLNTTDSVTLDNPNTPIAIEEDAPLSTSNTFFDIFSVIIIGVLIFGGVLLTKQLVRKFKK